MKKIIGVAMLACIPLAVVVFGVIAATHFYGSAERAALELAKSLLIAAAVGTFIGTALWLVGE